MTTMQQLPRWRRIIAWAVIVVSFVPALFIIGFLSARQRHKAIRREKLRKELYGRR